MMKRKASAFITIIVVFKYLVCLGASLIFFAEPAKLSGLNRVLQNLLLAESLLSFAGEKEYLLLAS